MSECTHDCSSCGESCADRQGGSPFQIKPLHEGCHVRKVYGVVSGKGGVGKSMVTSQLAVTMQRRGHRTAILDADVTGPVSYTHLDVYKRQTSPHTRRSPTTVFRQSQASVAYLAPLYFPRRVTRPVSYYALF